MASAFRGEVVKPVSVIVRAVLPGVAAALCASLTACTTAEEPTPTPTPTSSTPAIEPSPTPSVSYPGRVGNPPEPPQAFGRWKRQSSDQTKGFLYYDSADGHVTIGYTGNVTASKGRIDQQPTVIGHWLCETEKLGESGCHTDAWGGVVSIYRTGASKEELAAIGDELMKAWK